MADLDLPEDDLTDHTLTTIVVDRHLEDTVHLETAPHTVTATAAHVGITMKVDHDTCRLLAGQWMIIAVAHLRPVAVMAIRMAATTHRHHHQTRMRTMVALTTGDHPHETFLQVLPGTLAIHHESLTVESMTVMVDATGKSHFSLLNGVALLLIYFSSRYYDSALGLWSYVVASLALSLLVSMP